MVNVQTCYSDLDLILAQFIGSACAREEDSMESTRRIVMFNWMTANGYFAGADGNLDWVLPDEEQAKAALDGIPLFRLRAVRPSDLRALREILEPRR